LVAVGSTETIDFHDGIWERVACEEDDAPHLSDFLLGKLD
jgi:hypothetical protein